MSHRTLRALLIAAISLSGGAHRGGEARAQSFDPKNALAVQALYDQASAEMDAKSYASACPKLEEVTRLVPEGIGAKLTLGACYEALGKLASAWSQYALVETMAARAGQPERAQRAAERAAALKPKLATLTIDVAPDARSIPGITVLRDGSLVGEAQWGTPIPVDAGGHVIEARALGYTPWKKDVEIVSDGAKTSVIVRPLKADPTAAGSAPGAPIVIAPPPPDRTWQRPLGIAMTAIGGTGVGAGLLLGALAIAKNSESKSDDHCDASNLCDATGLGLRSQAVGLGNASTATLIAGAAVLAGGVAIFLTSPPEKKAPAEAARRSDGARSVTLGLAPTSVSITGRW